MKLSQFGRNVLAAVAITAMSLTVTACSVGHTIEFLYVATAKVSPGSIYAYKVDGASGTLTQMPDSPFSSGGRNPVAEVVSPNGLYLYVANHDDSDIVENAIGTDGKIYAQCTYDIPSSSSFPTAMAIDPAGKFLLVAFTYQAGYTDSVPGPGGIAVFPIQPLTATASASSLCTTGPGTLGTPVTNPANTSLQYFPVGNATTGSGLSPVGIAITANDFVYYATSGRSIASPGVNQIVVPSVLYGFSLNSNSGALTSTGSLTYSVSTQLSAVVADPSGKYLYVADQTLNHLNAYSISSSGGLTAISGSPYSTGNGPNAIAINKTTTPEYIYVANYNDNTISSYSISSTNGALTALPTGGSTNTQTGTNPNSILVDPALGYYLYTGNFIDNTVTGKQINTNNGGLINIQFTPFTTGGEPTALASTTSTAVVQ